MIAACLTAALGLAVYAWGRQATAPERPMTVIAFDFDDGIQADASGRYLGDSTGKLRGYEITRNDGRVSGVDRPGHGKAVRFPPPCPAGTTDCPRALIDVADAGFLNPGPGPFSFGADVLVTAEEARPGANMVQKGDGVSAGPASPGQWKIELGSKGEARCVLVAQTGVVFRAESIVVTDARWHRIRCTKSATALSIEVDATDPRSVPVPAELVFDSPNKPARFGGNNITNNVDRFSGALDNVYYRLG